jgi:hypothetical protein
VLELREILTSFRKDGSKKFKGNYDEGPIQSVTKMLCGNWTGNENRYAHMFKKKKKKKERKREQKSRTQIAELKNSSLVQPVYIDTYRL